METIHSYRDLLIWQKGIRIAENVYALTAEFPASELYALSSQMKRAAVSISSNIAEGYGRNGTASYVNFLKIARGSLYELETQAVIANKLGFVSETKLLTTLTLLEEESKMLNAFIRKLEEKIKK